METSYAVIQNAYHLETGEIVIVILKMKLMMSAYLIFMTKQITLVTKHQIISVIKLKKQQM